MFENSDLEALFSKRPDSKNISEIKQLNKFIQNYPDDTLKPNLYKLLQEHKQYRQVHGDGNCFYRAIMFLYLKQANLADYQVLFPPADLLKCKNLPFKMPKNLTSQHLLQVLWQRQLLNIANQSAYNKQKYLLEMINKSIVIDSILIAYLRVLNYDYLLIVKDELDPYTEGGIKNDIQRVLIYGKQSEGLEIYSLSKILNVTIEIVMVHQQNLTTVKYNQQANRMNTKLFYRPGHYDIICDRIDKNRHFSKVENPTFTENYNYNKNPNKISLNQNHLYMKNNQTASSSSSKIILVSKPSEIRLLNHSNQNNRASSSRKPKNIKQFRENLSCDRQSEFSRLNKQSSSQQISKKSIKIQSQKKSSNDKPKFQKIKSRHLNTAEQNQKQRLIIEGIICLVGIVALVGGALSL